MVQPYSHLKTCCTVTNNKYIPDKAVSRDTILSTKCGYNSYIAILNNDNFHKTYETN